jgi:basic amino acid/polyamine antiporter, APA family
MNLSRKIGKWSLTGLVINAVVGSALFGMSGDLVSLLGRASVLGVVAGGIATAIVMACFAEVASKFPQPGGPYIYARTTFGRFIGIQVGWFSWLVRLSSAAASATIFVSYLGGLVPSLEHGVGRAAVITVVLGLLTAANYIGVRSGANVSSVFAIAKLTPLLAIGIYGAIHAAGNSGIAIPIRELAVPGTGRWFEAFLLMSFLYGGFDTAMMPLGEVKEPRRTVPFALAGGLLVCIVVFTLVQVAVLSTTGAQASSRPLAQAAAVLFGPIGATLTSVAAIVSTYGYLSAGTLSVPRLTYAMAEQGDFPKVFARIHPRFNTPHVSIVIFGILTWTIAVTGSFKAAVALSVGARLITYVSTCGALIPLRRRHPEREGFKVPFGPALSVIACLMACALITRVHIREAIALAVTASLATASWWWTRRKDTGRNAAATGQF